MNDVRMLPADKDKVAEAHGGRDECQRRADATGPCLPSTPPKLLQHTDRDARRNHRRVVMTTCQTHGATGFTNLLVTKEDGIIVLNPHVANCCVLKLDEQAATALHGILTEWLG
jgi:hypothetical protein